MAKMKYFPSSSLRAKLLLLMTLAFAILIGFSTIKSFNNFETIKQDQQAEFKSASSLIESEQHRHLAQARMVAFIAMNQIRKGLTLKICQRGVVGEPGLDPEFGQFAIADTNGNISCNSIPWLTAKNVADENYFKEAMKRADIGFIDQPETHTPGQYHALMARSMRDDGHVLKVILVAMDFSWTKEEVGMIHLPASGHLLVVDAAGTVIAGSNNMADWIDKSLVGTPFYERIVANQNIGDLGFGGVPSIIQVHQFQTGSGSMRVIVDIPKVDLLEPAYHSLFITLSVNLLVFSILFALIYYGSNKYFLRRISSIDHAAKSLAGGDLTARVHISDGDELGHLAESFDAMADTIQADEAKLKAANEELNRVNRSLLTLSAGNRTLLFAKTEKELLDRICQEIVEKGGYLGTWIGFVGIGPDKYMHAAASYLKVNDETTRNDWQNSANQLEPVIAAVHEDKVWVVNDINHEAVHSHLVDHATKFNYRSVIILPLHLAGKPFGALIIVSPLNDEFSCIEVEYLIETASDTSFGIDMLRTKGDNVRLTYLGEHHEQLLRESLEDALRAISLTIEMRDPYTSGHQRRVAELAKVLAQELRLNEDEVHGIYLAAIVHDIGKIQVPAEILVKPGRLNDIEYSLVKSHVASSYEILKDIKFPWPIADMVHQHHERMDGSGYPLKLKDGEILFGARILAVADVVEAMSSHRPYRPSLGIEVALKEIERGRATIYDEVIVDACLKLFSEGRFKFEKV